MSNHSTSSQRMSLLTRASSFCEFNGTQDSEIAANKRTTILGRFTLSHEFPLRWSVRFSRGNRRYELSAKERGVRHICRLRAHGGQRNEDFGLRCLHAPYLIL
jgi:hypothetical protein